MESYSSENRNKTRMPILTILFKIALEGLVRAIRQEKEIKVIQIGKEEVIYRLNAIPIRNPMTIFTEVEQRILKFMWNNKIPQITKAIQRKKKKGGDIMLLDFK